MNRPHWGFSIVASEHLHTIALLAFLLATFGTAAYPSLVEAVTFTDDFNRPDSATVGNGWSDTTGNLGNLAIRTNELTCPSGSGGTFRPFPFTAPITTAARVKEESGSGTLLRRYVTRFLVRNNGTFNQGYGVLVVRSDQNFDNSQVILVEDNAQLASIPSTFQYGPEIHISVTFNLDGSITGTVSEPAPSTNTFRFSFGPHAIQSTGDNFSIAVECSSGPVDQRIDDVVITETLSDCETTLPFGWPTASGAGQVSQDYAEFDGSAASRRTQEVCNPTTGVCQLLVKPHYHTGMDLASPVSVTEPDRSQQVFAAGRGEIVAVCPNVPGGCEFDGTRFSRPDTNDNHGLQGAVILKHTVTESNMVYSLYAHLGTTEAFQPGECIEQGTLIGATGGLPDGHLHFEVKSAPVLSNPLTAPGTCIDPGTKKPSAVCFGYTLVNPNTRAYFDPVEYLHLLDKSGFPKAVILSDRKDKKIKADSGPGAFGDAYPVVGKAEQGTYTALSKVFGATTDPSCADSWYQIWHASNDCSVLGNCFTQNAKSTKDSVPEAWVCSDFVKE